MWLRWQAGSKWVRRAWLPACACLLLAIPASGQDVAVDGLPVAEYANLAGHDLQLNGAGLRTIWGFHIYVAALYLPEKAHSASDILAQDQPRRMQITLLRGVTTEQNLEALKNGLIANNSPAEMAAIDADVEHFLGLLRQLHELSAGTVIRFDYLPGLGTQVRVGERDFGRIPGARFNQAILRIWLGEDPIQVSLKKALLGLARPS
ncbi:MAG: chalcone isomerase family protein [Gallionellaceae bacterium]|nr:chalcone isomerase family protein [Gallionellaceae bacterium]